MAWTRKFLRVNLNRGSCVSEPLNMAWAAQFLGQWGLASKYLVSEIDPGADPLAPDNKLIYATGPLTGTMASTGGRYSVVTKGPLTGAVACSNSGGYFGAELKFAGWDMIIIEGRSPQPVYLHIENERAELLPAGDLWGRTVWDTEAMLRKRHQDSLLRVSSIGRAGENLVLFAAIVNDLHRAAGRSGVGAVMGSKNLKAVAVRGTRGLGNIADPQAFMAAVTAGKRVLAENAVTGQGLPTYGTQVLMNVINEMGASPTRNHRDVQFEGARRISAEAMHEQRATDGRTHLVTNQACCGCTIACGRISRIDESHFSVANKPQYLGGKWWSRIRGGVGARQRERGRRSRSPAVREPAVQRGRHGPDLLRGDGWRGHGTVRTRRPEQGRDRHRGAIRFGRGPLPVRRDDRARRLASPSF